MPAPRTIALWVASVTGSALLFALLALALSSGAFVAHVAPEPADKPVSKARPQPPGGARALHIARKQVIENCQVRAQNTPDDPRAWALLGAAYLDLARATGDRNLYADAEPALRRALELSEAPDALARESLATCLLLQLRLKEAAEFIDESIKLLPQHAAFTALKGDVFLALGQYEEAAQQYAHYGARESGDRCTVRLAHLEIVRGDPARARAMLEATANAHVVDAESPAWLCVQLGLIDLNAGNLSNARAEFSEALQWAPLWHSALLPLARCEELMGDLEAARLHLNDAHSVSRTPVVMLALARVEGALGNYNRAALLHSEALRLLQVRLTLDDAAALRPFALALLHAGAKPEAALEYAAQDVALREDIYSCAVLAWARSANGLHKEALEALARALRLNTRDATLWLAAERVYRSAGEGAKADEALRRAHEINPFTKGRESQWLAGWR